MSVQTNMPEIRAILRRMNPMQRTEILRSALAETGELIANNSRLAMKRGGSAPPLPSKLTSRTGTGRRSIRSNRPQRTHVDVGTDLRYMAVHEFGGSFTVKAHSRTSKAGKRFRVKSYRASYPRRPFLEPGLRKSRPGIERIFERHLARVLETA